MNSPKDIKLGISACLLGENVRYDGGNKLDAVIRDALDDYVEWVPVCPEVECGLPVPRDAMQLVGSCGSCRLVTVNTGIDHTDKLLSWVRIKLEELEKANLHGFIFKDRSPSCGLSGVKIYSSGGVVNEDGSGIFASEFLKHFSLLPVEGADRLHDPALMEKFMARLLST
jgi:uncharacterized protein YbbK (DUF523 family)